MTITGDSLYSRGEELQLNCSSEGRPALEYTWLISGDVIPNVNTDTLTIDNVNTTHAGDYTCNVTNDAGTDSDTITVYSKSHTVSIFDMTIGMSLFSLFSHLFFFVAILFKPGACLVS